MITRTKQLTTQLCSQLEVPLRGHGDETPFLLGIKSNSCFLEVLTTPMGMSKVVTTANSQQSRTRAAAKCEKAAAKAKGKAAKAKPKASARAVASPLLNAEQAAVVSVEQPICAEVLEARWCNVVSATLVTTTSVTTAVTITRKMPTTANYKTNQLHQRQL